MVGVASLVGTKLDNVCCPPLVPGDAGLRTGTVDGGNLALVLLMLCCVCTSKASDYVLEYLIVYGTPPAVLKNAKSVLSKCHSIARELEAECRRNSIEWRFSMLKIQQWVIRVEKTRMPGHRPAPRTDPQH